LPVLDASCFGPVLSIAKPDFPIHDLSKVWKPMPDNDFARMVETAKRFGGIHNDPAVVWEGKIIDGRHRQAACVKAGVPFQYREFHGDYDAAREWVIAKNFNRRHMTPSQRAMMVASLQECDNKHKPRTDQAISIAATAQVSRDLAGQALQLKKTGDDILIEKVLSGETSISKALREKKKEMQKIPGADDRTALGTNIRRRDRVDLSEDMYTDATGKVVPPALQEAWKFEGTFSTQRDQVERTILFTKRLMQSPAGVGLSETHLKNLGDLARDLDMKRPYYICPHCEGNGDCTCDKCQRKWLGRGVGQSKKCYPCNGHGFLMKDELFPTREWHKWNQPKESEDDRAGTGESEGLGECDTGGSPDTAGSSIEGATPSGTDANGAGGTGASEQFSDGEHVPDATEAWYPAPEPEGSGADSSVLPDPGAAEDTELSPVDIAGGSGWDSGDETELAEHSDADNWGNV
jgi:hypothetical protein